MRATFKFAGFRARLRLAAANEGVISLVLDDSVSTAEVVSKSFGRTLSDAAGSKDGPSRSYARFLADGVAAADSAQVDNQTAAGQLTKSLAEVVTARGSLSFHDFAVFVDNVSTGESVVVTLLHGLSPLRVDEFVGASDAPALQLLRTLIDTVQAVDTPTLSLSGAVTDYADPSYFADDYVGAAAPAGDYADPTYFAETYTA